MKTMLIVEDSSYMRDIIKILVKDLDIEVIGEAENGKEGVEKYIKYMPDIVTMDLAMEVEDGYDALKKIMSHNPKAAVIVITSASGQKPVIEEVLKLGAKVVFSKPVNKTQFVEYMNELILQL